MAASNGSEYFELDIEMGNESFSRPSNAEEVARDERELLWAALESLPSQKQKNFALLRRSADNAEETTTEAIDVRKLNRVNRELLVKAAFNTPDQDNFKLLSAIKERLGRVGLEVPKIEVWFEHLNVTANVQVGSRALPTLVNYVRDKIENVLKGLRIFRPKRHSLTILNDISGSIKTGRYACSRS